MLKTEQRNERSANIDKMDTLSMMKLMQSENENAVRAVGDAARSIAAAVDAISARMNKGGRLFYVGCGTSGRLGVLDASECPPTYGVDKSVVTGIIAGGDAALRSAVEAVEDDGKAGADDLRKFGITEKDSVIGISVAGGAKYVIGALEYARAAGALTVALTSNENTAICAAADTAIVTDTGAEVITGSTRMKAGSAHKMVLNMISTAVMVKAGCVYENLMINLKPSNSKLRERMIRIVCDVTGKDREKAERLLTETGFNIRRAIDSDKI